MDLIVSVPVSICHYSVYHFVFDFCLHDILYRDNGHIQFHSRMSPLQKLRVKGLIIDVKNDCE